MTAKTTASVATDAGTQPVEKRDFTLPIDHEHEGKKYQKGETISLYPKQIQLIEKIAKDLAMAAAKSAEVIIK